MAEPSKNGITTIDEWSRDVPWHRRFEVCSIGIVTFAIYLAGLAATFALILVLIFGNNYLRTLALLYMIFYYFDFDTPYRGGRRAGCEWIRNLKCWKYAIDYFPVDLVKTVDLPPNRNYLFAACPHAIVTFGVLMNCITNHSKWRNLFPGIRSKLVTLNVNLNFPFYRELLLSWGMSNTSAENINYLLSQPTEPVAKVNDDGFTSNGVFLMFGGAHEAFYCAPNTYKIFLNQRKGFVRIAIQNGVGLVPTITFGDTDIYDTTQNESGSILRKLQELVKKYTTISPVMFNGRGLFQQYFGIIPKRRPLTVVTGAPIFLEKNPTPTQERIDEIHSLFREKLLELFETHKSKYIDNSENVRMEII